MPRSYFFAENQCFVLLHIALIEVRAYFLPSITPSRSVRLLGWLAFVVVPGVWPFPNAEIFETLGGQWKINKNFNSMGFLSLCAAVFLGGGSQVLLFDPKGPIREAKGFVVIAAFVLMLIVVLPILVMTFRFPWKYRASNLKASYTPKWSYSPKIDLIICLVPTAIIVALAFMAWSRTHHLDPYKPIDPGVESISI